MKCLIGINNLTHVEQMAYANHLQLFYRLGVMKGHADRDGDEVEFVLFNPRRMSIDRMRNTAAKMAMEYDLDYLWFIDDDVLIPSAWNNKPFNSFKILHDSNKDVCAGVTLVRGYPFHPMIFNYTDAAYKKNSFVVDYAEKANKDNGLLECDAVGFSCCLIKVSLLKKMIPPYFVTSLPGLGYSHTEDVYFCKKAKEQVSDVQIYVNTRVRTAHILGPEVIEPGNIELWKEFEEKRVPNIKEQIEADEDKKFRQDRDPETLKNIIAAI